MASFLSPFARKLLQTTNLRHRGTGNTRREKETVFRFSVVSRVGDSLLYALFSSLLFEEEKYPAQSVAVIYDRILIDNLTIYSRRKMDFVSTRPVYDIVPPPIFHLEPFSTGSRLAPVKLDRRDQFFTRFLQTREKNTTFFSFLFFFQ